MMNALFNNTPDILVRITYAVPYPTTREASPVTRVIPRALSYMDTGMFVVRMKERLSVFSETTEAVSRDR